MSNLDAEPTGSSYTQEISDSLNSFLFGLFLLCLVTMTMYFVEHQAVEFAMILSRAQTACRTIKDIITLNKNYNGRCVMVKGVSKVTGNFKKANEDTDTGFKADAAVRGNVVRQRRSVEMYQWIEKKTKGEKGERDRYNYVQEWSSTYHDSKMFAQESHHNPPMSPNLSSRTENATENTFVGAYSLSDRQINMMSDFVNIDLPLSSAADFVKHADCTDPSTQKSTDGKSYIVFRPKTSGSGKSANHSEGNDTTHINNPVVGMVRIQYACVFDGGKVTTVGVLNGDTFCAFTEKDAHKTLGGHTKYLCCSGAPSHGASTRGDGDLSQHLTYSESGGDDDAGSDDDVPRNTGSSGCYCTMCCQVLGILKPIMEKLVAMVVGKDVLLLEEKHFGVARMFRSANDNFSYRLRIIRLVCVILFWASITMIFSPISTVLNWIPFIGGLVSSLFGVVTFLLAMVLAFLVFSICWTVFHPEFLGVLLLTAGLLCVFSTTATAGVVAAGYVLSVLSLAPFTLLVLNWMEDRSFLQEQARLDDEFSHMKSGSDVHYEKTNLLSNAV